MVRHRRYARPRMTRFPVLEWSGAVVLVVLAAAAVVAAVATPGVAPAHTARQSPTAATKFAAAPVETRPSRPPAAAELVPPGRATVRVPILMYHYIRVVTDPRDQLGFNLSVTPADFGQQMDWLQANGYHPIDLDDLRGYLLENRTLPARPIVLTFDDGYRDLYTTAFPVLHRHHFKAVSYVVTGFVGSPNNVSADQILEMEANGVQIAAHTVSHADLTKLSPADLRHEVADSKAWLEGLLGHPVLDFCYPSGRVNAAVVQAVQAAGFQSATTTQPGQVHSAADRFMWTRVRVSGGEPLQRLTADLGQPEPAQQGPLTAAALEPGRLADLQLPITFPLRAPPAAQPAALRREDVLP